MPRSAETLQCHSPLDAAARHSPAAERNRAPILRELKQLLPAQGTALEIASGTGQHVAFFAAGLPGWVWQPSDAVGETFSSIASWCRRAGATNVRSPVLLDVMAPCWPSAGPEFENGFDLIFCANMLHIAPWATCAALMRGASRHLAPDGQLITYGPYVQSDLDTSPGNLAFDTSLRQRNAEWGVRHLDDVGHAAARAGLQLRSRLQMPANNLLLVFARSAASEKSTA